MIKTRLKSLKYRFVTFKINDAHHFVHLCVVEAHPGAVESHFGAVEAHFGAVEAHFGAVEAYFGAVEAHPGGEKKCNAHRTNFKSADFSEPFILD